MGINRVSPFILFLIMAAVIASVAVQIALLPGHLQSSKNSLG